MSGQYLSAAAAKSKAGHTALGREYTRTRCSRAHGNWLPRVAAMLRSACVCSDQGSRGVTQTAGIFESILGSLGLISPSCGRLGEIDSNLTGEGR